MDFPDFPRLLGPIDGDALTFEQFVVFVFERPIKPPYDSNQSHEEQDQHYRHYLSERLKPWYWRGTPERILPHLTRIFEAPEFLLDRYNEDQLNTGFWFLSGGNFSRWIWDQDVDWPLRHSVIRAMLPLSERLFARNPAGDACSMWWDGYRTFEDDPDPRVLDAMLETLTQILALPSRACRGSALHGLGHLEHPGKRAVIERYLAEHPDIDDDERSYALAAIDGNVL